MKSIALMVLAISAVPLFAAVDMFVKIDRVNGTAADSAHQGWFEVTNWTWAPSQAKFSAMPSSESKLKQMCNAHARAATMTVDIKGQRHTLHNVAFRTCEAKTLTIYFERRVPGGPSPIPIPYPNLTATQ